jgi:hypothetical protein
MGMGCDGGSCPGPVFMSLLQQHSKISRDVQHTNSGINSLTQSEDPQVAALIKTHVAQMKALLESCAKGQCSHTPRYFDPLFRAVYSNADKLDMKVGLLLLLFCCATSLLLVLMLVLVLVLLLWFSAAVVTPPPPGAWGRHGSVWGWYLPWW